MEGLFWPAPLYAAEKGGYPPWWGTGYSSSDTDMLVSVPERKL